MRTLLLLALIALSVAGCRPKDKIRTYRIAKAPGDASPAVPDATPDPEPASGPPTHRMIGSIVPGNDRAWFFKAVGPKEIVDASADAIRDFLASVRLEAGQPAWDRPEDWGVGGDKPMRLATLMVPGADARDIELSVIGLPLTGEWRPQVLSNVNRWRGQLKLGPITLADLEEKTSPLPEVGKEAVLFDELGRFDDGGMAPFAGRAAPFARGAAAAPPQPPRTPLAPPPSTKLKYDTPEGWTADREPNPIRKASLTTDGGATATAFVFAAAGAMGDPLENANRWRGEVGLPATTADSLAEASEAIELLGREGQRFEFVGEAEATTAAMVQIDQAVWFFKLRGPKEEVAKQRDAFDAWLASLSL